MLGCCISVGLTSDPTPPLFFLGGGGILALIADYESNGCNKANSALQLTWLIYKGLLQHAVTQTAETQCYKDWWAWAFSQQQEAWRPVI